VSGSASRTRDRLRNAISTAIFTGLGMELFNLPLDQRSSRRDEYQPPVNGVRHFGSPCPRTHTLLRDAPLPG
jgi:hypothetical protein